MPSICPLTICPPSLSPANTALSRLTLSPAVKELKLLLLMVTGFNLYFSRLGRFYYVLDFPDFFYQSGKHIITSYYSNFLYFLFAGYLI